jgi:carboxylate-amine ligase
VARHGLDARIVSDDGLTVAPVRSEIERLLTDLRPIAARLGTTAHLDVITTILDGGAGYERQRAVTVTDGELTGVARLLVDELAADRMLIDRIGRATGGTNTVA